MKCWFCGKEADYVRPTAYTQAGEKGMHYKTKDFGNYRSYCVECKRKHDEETKSDKERYVILKKKLMYERALELLEAQGCEMEKIRNSAIMTQKYLYAHIDKFDSADEIIAAIILISRGVKIQPQAKVGRYQVDFLLPDLNVVLEVDGYLHKTRKKYDTQRDTEIRETLGKDWEVVRISTKALETKAIKTSIITLLTKIQILQYINNNLFNTENSIFIQFSISNSK